MDEILGFIALTGPIIPVLVWLAVCVLLVLFVIKPKGTPARRVTIKTIAFVSIFFLPFLDEIIGQIYLDHLCDTQGGFKVFHTVELPDRYWDENGDALFIKYTKIKNIPQLDKVNGTLNFSVLPEYSLDREVKIYSPIFSIRILRYWYFDKKTSEILAENITFDFPGGWFINTFTVGGGASCVYSDRLNNKEQILSIFIPKFN